MASRIIQAYLYALAWLYACMGLIQLPGHVSFVDGSFMCAIGSFATVIFYFLSLLLSPYYPNFYCPNVPGNGSRVMTPFLLSLALHPAYQGSIGGRSPGQVPSPLSQGS
ncbi:hypothetical protein, partial [Parabacteroides goldsteinii]|uniref:hypothetical protein n=1 Tax=Parabacteroides goldsteinii TaxID=328812 RepID=UPI0025A5E741